MHPGTNFNSLPPMHRQGRPIHPSSQLLHIFTRIYLQTIIRNNNNMNDKILPFFFFLKVKFGTQTIQLYPVGSGRLLHSFIHIPNPSTHKSPLTPYNKHHKQHHLLMLSTIFPHSFFKVISTILPSHSAIVFIIHRFVCCSNVNKT